MISSKLKKLLEEISIKAIELGEIEFTPEEKETKWLGNSPVSETEIKITEERLGLKFPVDFKCFLKISNGFSAPNDVEPTFEDISKIDFLKNVDKFIIEAYNIEETKYLSKELEKSILIGGINEEQYFLLIPPNLIQENWKYWKFANWYPGEEEFNNLESYLQEVLDSLGNSLNLI